MARLNNASIEQLPDVVVDYCLLFRVEAAVPAGDRFVLSSVDVDRVHVLDPRRVLARGEKVGLLREGFSN